MVVVAAVQNWDLKWELINEDNPCAASLHTRACNVSHNAGEL